MDFGVKRVRVENGSEVDVEGSPYEQYDRILKSEPDRSDGSRLSNEVAQYAYCHRSVVDCASECKDNKDAFSYAYLLATAAVGDNHRPD